MVLGFTDERDLSPIDVFGGTVARRAFNMSVVTIRDVIFLNNPARFSDDYKFRVTFECIAPLKDGEGFFFLLSLRISCPC